MTERKKQEVCLRLSALFGYDVADYSQIPAHLTDFFEAVGYTRLCSFFVLEELKQGRSEVRVGRRYGITRRQVQTIKKRAKWAR